MESNNCVCQNYFLKLLEKFLNTLLRTTSQVIRNTNTPAIDSGYVNNSNMHTYFNNVENNSINETSSNLSNTFNTILLAIGLTLMLFMMKFKGEKNKKSLISSSK